MLAPRDRRLLLDGLRPPAGYRLDRAVGTSYSLDLLALLAAPLAFTFYDCEDSDDRPTSDPLVLLQAIRRHADRIHLFCQAGRIAVPRPGQHLLHYLETTVIEARAPKDGGSFHPKVWALRFIAGTAEPVRYRLLCLSRNLTFDQSWDTALVLDGELLGSRTRAIAANHALGDFLAALPGMAVHDLPAATKSAIASMADEIRRVRFELPERVDDIAFWPLGLPNRRPFSLPEPSRRLLIVSPFLSSDLLDRLSAGRTPGILVSEPQALTEMPATVLDRFSEVLVLRPGAEGDAADEGTPFSEYDTPQAGGLHAKLFVMDDGKYARIWTGSANATVSAFDRNVEFLVELRGTKGALGIDAFLGTDDGSETTFRNLLQPFPREALRPPDEAARALELLLDSARMTVASAGLTVEILQTPGDEAFSMSLTGEVRSGAIPAGISLTCWPATLPSDMAIPIDVAATTLAKFSPVSFEALTGFWAFEVSGSLAAHKGTIRFTLNLPLVGAPVDRSQRLLHSLLKDREHVLRLLLLLLGGEDVAVGTMAQLVQGVVGDFPGVGMASGLPLLEALLRALDRDPRRLDDIARLVDDLQRTPEGRALLPGGFETVWTPIWEAYRGGPR